MEGAQGNLGVKLASSNMKSISHLFDELQLQVKLGL